MELLGFGLAALIGLSLGTLGGGGSILTVPIFHYILGYPAKQAIVMSLPVVGVTALVGVATHWRAGNVRVSTAVFFGALTMVGSFAGARALAPLLSGELQLALLALVMLAAAISMFRSARRTDAAPGSRPTGRALALLGLVGLGVGMLTGLIGIGGGFLIVPALVLLARVPMKQAVGTSLCVIALNTGSGFLGYAGRETVPWGFVAGFTAVAVLGIVAGTRLVHYLAPATLKRAFAAFLLVVGAAILYQNRAAFSPATPAVRSGSR